MKDIKKLSDFSHILQKELFDIKIKIYKNKGTFPDVLSRCK